MLCLVPLLLFAVVLLASWLPARRAAAIDPITNSVVNVSDIFVSFRAPYILRSQFATDCGSNRTSGSDPERRNPSGGDMLVDCTSEKQRKPASSLAVGARPTFSISSARDIS